MHITSREGAFDLLRIAASSNSNVRCLENPTMEHFVAYHSVKRMGRTLEPDGELHFHSRKLGLLRKAVGNTVWIIQGSPDGKRTTYSLHGAYVADSLQGVAEDPGLYRIRGASGIDFNPPIPLNDLEWFPVLLQTQSNFSLGFNRVSDGRVEEELLALRGRQTDAIPNGELPDVDLQVSEIEGAPRLVSHLRRERSRKLVKAKKAAVIAAGGTLACEVCGFDFQLIYGAWGEGFCEIHHKVPIATTDASTATKLEDLAVLCSNCHRVVHRIEPMPSIETLSTRVRREGT